MSLPKMKLFKYSIVALFAYALVNVISLIIIALDPEMRTDSFLLVDSILSTFVFPLFPLIMLSSLLFFREKFRLEIFTFFSLLAFLSFALTPPYGGVILGGLEFLGTFGYFLIALVVLELIVAFSIMFIKNVKARKLIAKPYSISTLSITYLTVFLSVFVITLKGEGGMAILVLIPVFIILNFVVPVVTVIITAIASTFSKD